MIARRGARSATWPPGSTSSMNGRNSHSPSRPSANGSRVSAYTCQPTATANICPASVAAQRPMTKQAASRGYRGAAGRAPVPAGSSLTHGSPRTGLSPARPARAARRASSGRPRRSARCSSVGHDLLQLDRPVGIEHAPRVRRLFAVEQQVRCTYPRPAGLELGAPVAHRRAHLVARIGEHFIATIDRPGPDAGQKARVRHRQAGIGAAQRLGQFLQIR